MAGGITISCVLIHNVKTIHRLCMEDHIGAKAGCYPRVGINCQSNHALPGYISAVAAVEAFISEFFLSDRTLMPASDLWKLDQDWLEKVRLTEKLILVPQLLFGKTFDRGKQPYQDMKTLIALRNGLVHYKMDSATPRYVADLQQRGFALPSVIPSSPFGQRPMPWADIVACSEGIRWAHNTVCDVVWHLYDICKHELHDFLDGYIEDSFRRIDESDVRQRCAENGIDPVSSAI